MTRKITKEREDRILKMLADGVQKNVIAKYLGIHARTVRQIELRRENGKYIYESNTNGTNKGEGCLQ